MEIETEDSARDKTPTAISCITIFIFYDMAQGAQSKLSFSDEFRHCNSITFDGKDWIMLEFDRTGFVMRKINCSSASKLIKSLRIVKEITAIVTVAVGRRKRVWWKPWLIRSCNEFARYAAGVDIGWTFNPYSLFKKLIKYNGTTNYKILSAWRRQDGISRR